MVVVLQHIHPPARRSRILRHLLGISDAGAPNQTGMYANIAIGLAADRGQRCQCELEKENDIFFVFCTQPKNINSLPMEILHCAHLEAGQQEMQNNLTRSTRQQLHQQYVSGFYFLVSLFFYWTEEIEGNLYCEIWNLSELNIGHEKGVQIELCKL